MDDCKNYRSLYHMSLINVYPANHKICIHYKLFIEVTSENVRFYGQICSHMQHKQFSHNLCHKLNNAVNKCWQFPIHISTGFMLLWPLTRGYGLSCRLVSRHSQCMCWEIKQNMKISLQSIRSVRFKLQTCWTCYCYYHNQTCTLLWYCLMLITLV